MEYVLRTNYIIFTNNLIRSIIEQNYSYIIRVRKILIFTLLEILKNILIELNFYFI